MPALFRAKILATCPACDATIEPGEWVAFQGDHLVHGVHHSDRETRDEAVKLTQRPPVMRAKKSGACSRCRGGWRAKTLITFVDGEWIHSRCARGERPAPKWTRRDTPEARAYLAALAAGGDTFLSRRRASWTP